MEPIRLYLKDIKNIPLLSPEEELDLAKKVKKGNENARQKMINSNLRLVINIAKRYSYLGLPMLDLIEEGNLGLMHAVRKFNPKKGYRFSTYAAWWIKQYITRAIANQGKTIRVPVYMVELLLKYKKASNELYERYHRRPTMEQIAKKMKIPLKKVKRLNNIAGKISSLNAPVGEEGENEFIELVEDQGAPIAAEEVMDFLRQEKVDELLKNLSARERTVLTLRYGLTDGRTRTLDETSKKFDITRERVRQIENAAIRKLRILLFKKGEEANVI